MSIGLEKLLSIGIDKIHEQTHITKKHIDAVLNERFEDLSKVQFLGFISIFQREYGVKLEDLRQKGLEFYNQTTTTISEDSSIFISKDKKKTVNFMYISVTAILFLVVVAISFFNPSNSFEEIKEIDAVDNTTIKTAQINMQNYKKSIKTQEKNVTVEKKATLDENVTKKKIEVIKEPDIFKIEPKRKVWIGYIDLSNHKRYQKTLKNELELDTKKDWLLVLGNSNVNFDINGDIVKFKTRYNLRLLYKDSKLTKLTLEEFKKLNRGKKW